ncbi:hypothetical protein [Streptomyces formicae]|uniref:Tail assembly chaperone n=1 Tax=Streptomyces formicae TaxID=1616117 RepID=A0ABY3WQM3_9ACTN|nr:hypothetical protein [Streptomyces formicae]UNM13764.1 hypothetical protein J4032_21960 [Streptomyces formicae]
MPDIKDVLAKAKPREHTVRICLAGDVAAEVDRLEAELASVSNWQAESLVDKNPGIEIAERIKEARERMQAAEVEFTFKALGAKAWSDLVAQHPGKKDEEAWDVETLAPALVAASAVDPAMTQAEVDELFDALNFGQRQQLIDAAWQVNGEATSIPFSLHASAILASRTDGK